MSRGFPGFFPGDTRYLVYYLLTARRTEADIRPAYYYLFRICETAGMAAGTAISPGKYFEYHFDLFIFLYMKFL